MHTDVDSHGCPPPSHPQGIARRMEDEAATPDPVSIYYQGLNAVAPGASLSSWGSSLSSKLPLDEAVGH